MAGPATPSAPPAPAQPPFSAVLLPPSPPQELEAVGAGPELDRMVAEFEASQAAKKKAAAAGRR